ncbi:cytochrome c oxidase subunit II [Enterovirga aerilata]|uniref:Cytochrome c oxidase subunit 2 n=1 Tax=Enterovirga aerilata TaxID=2730920 RepID=A0A849I0W8_9HYPH|nr:cytochrome c oxidase subunit II [Enterovirga sp. DB1703]NNM72992.1 cytochrome c oxidase subunit II [Enterovirga sp. DB1703]
MANRLRGAASGLIAAGLTGCAGAALAAGIGQPEEWQVAMQQPVTAVAREMHDFHTELMWIITAIVLFVLALLVVVVVRFNERANPTPSKTSHNTAIEIAWTVVPVLILLLIAIPSFRLLRNQLIIPNADITLKTTGHSWYWSYEYPADQGGGFQFDANLIEAADLKPGQPRLLATDNEVVLPVNKVVRLQTTSADVIHSWGVPSLGFTLDAVPGRLNEMWFKIEREGVYYGQCRELCGQRHAYMPITIRAVSEAEYAAWLAQAKQKFASTAADDAKLADASR